MNRRPLLAAIGLAVFALAGPAAALRNDHGVNVVNQSTTTIEYFYFSACRDPNWGPDRLGATEVIAPRASRFFSMDDGIPGCCRDMLAKFVKGATRQRKSVDVCTEYEWVVR